MAWTIISEHATSVSSAVNDIHSEVKSLWRRAVNDEIYQSFRPYEIIYSIFLPCRIDQMCLTLAKKHRPGSLRLCFSCPTSKLPGMTILRWTLIQESNFYPHYLCWTRGRTLGEKKDFFFFILLSLHTFIFHSYGLYTIILSLFSLSSICPLDFWCQERQNKKEQRRNKGSR